MQTVSSILLISLPVKSLFDVVNMRHIELQDENSTSYYDVINVKAMKHKNEILCMV